MDEKLASQILEEASELLDTADWIQGDFQSRNGYCALGAINVVSLGHAYQIGSTGHNREAKAALRGLIGDIAVFNDFPGRTKTEVQDKMIEAAKVLRSVGK